MAFLNKNWLTGTGNKSHGLCRVSLKRSAAWTTDDSVKLTFELAQEDGNRMFLRLTDDDISEVMRGLLSEMSKPELLSFLKEALAGEND